MTVCVGEIDCVGLCVANCDIVWLRVGIWVNEGVADWLRVPVGEPVSVCDGVFVPDLDIVNVGDNDDVWVKDGIQTPPVLAVAFPNCRNGNN